MGRKKIEIKPLTDERNRNVTFLKRKAGLMKKAHELSVLCGVSVNILIFGANGKPYEFSSGDFDTDVDRYNDYEGTIERRRGAEFEAMALAGEDSDDEERPGGPAAGKPAKSLKGKESFKARRIGVASGHDSGHSMNGNGKRPREREDSFVGGIFDDELTPPPPQRPDSPSAGLNYALGLQNQQQQSQQQPPQWYRQPQPYHLGGGGPPFLPVPGQGWDNSMVTTYAWLQIQQAHQEQKRHLLEKQQQQLLELTSRSGGAAFLRDMLGAGLANGGGGPPQANQEFVWPTVSETPEREHPQDDGLIWALAGGAAGPSREKRR